MGVDVKILDFIGVDIEIIFDGYENDKLIVEVKVLIEGEDFVDSIIEGNKVIIVIDIILFYVEMGG